MAYGISITAEGLGQIVSGAMGTIPIVGSLVSSGIQGITNGSFAVMIGVQTKKFLINDFHLQDMLDNVILDSIEEDEKLFSAVAEDVKKEDPRVKPARSYLQIQQLYNSILHRLFDGVFILNPNKKILC